MSAVNLLDVFNLSLVERSAMAGLEWEGSTYTFGEIGARSDRLAAVLRSRGFQRGDRLCVQLANRVELIDLFLAAIKLGVIFVPVNILYKEREVAHIVSDAEPREVISESNLAELYVTGSEGFGRARRGSGGTAFRMIDPPSLELDTPAAIIYTSGTTGPSKGAILTHGNFIANARNLVEAWRITDDDRFLLALPLFHIHALGNGLHCWLMSGCRMRLLERFDHRTAAAEFESFQPTLFFGVPTIYLRLLDLPDDEACDIGSRMRLFVSGSAPLPAHVFERFREKYGHAILERYGMTETFMTLSNPYEGERRPGTVGFPLAGVEVRTENGQLLVRSPTVFAGYWGKPDETAAAFTEDGFFRTGDLCSLSDDGYFTLEGRKSDLIISGGFNIYPREIEEWLLEQDGVVDAAVVGVADEQRGEVPVAFVVGEFVPEVLARKCRDSLATFKVPRRFVRVQAIPKTALGKPQKHLLRET